MGCWAINSFGNDDAADWLAELEERPDVAMVEDAPARVLNAGRDYLEAPDATRALAAVEVVAAAIGHAGNAVQDRDALRQWMAKVKPQPSLRLIDDALRVLERILSPASELDDLWRETDEYGEWRQDVEALRNRLGRSGTDVD